MELRITGSRYVDDSFLITLTTQCKGLQTISLSQCNEVTDVFFMRLNQNCTKLKEVSLQECNSVTDGSVQLLVANCPIDKISLLSCIMVTNACLQYIKHHCGKRLLALHLDGVLLTHSELLSIGHACRQLDALSIRNAQLISTEMIPLHSDRLFDSLHSLDVGGNAKLSAEYLSSLLSSTSVFLTSLSLCRCKQVTEDTVDQVINTFRYLQAVDVSYCENLADRAVIKLVSRYGAQLSELRIAGHRKINKTTLREVAAHCSNLGYLDISSCSQLNTASVLNVLDTCSSLRELKMDNCKNVETIKVQHHVQNNKICCILKV